MGSHLQEALYGNSVSKTATQQGITGRKKIHAENGWKIFSVY